MLTGGFLSVDDLTAQYQSGGIGYVQVIHCRPRVNQGQDRQILEEQVGDWLVKGHLVYCSCVLLLEEQEGDCVVKGHLVYCSCMLLLKEQVGDWVVKGHLVYCSYRL